MKMKNYEKHTLQPIKVHAFLIRKMFIKNEAQLAKILRKSLENHKAHVQENAKKITFHLLHMPEIDTGSLLETLV